MKTARRMESPLSTSRYALCNGSSLISTGSLCAFCVISNIIKTCWGGNFLTRIYHKSQYFRYSHLHAKYRAKTGIKINPNCAGAGLHISHGKCVVSSIARLGEHCKILSDVTIGGQGRYDVPGAPTIGNRVFIASGAKVIGPITIADGVVIGANAVVTRDILEPDTTWAGILARKVSDKGSTPYLRKEFTINGKNSIQQNGL